MPSITTICSAQHRIGPTSSPLKPCKDCKHFLPPSTSTSSNLKYGRCHLFGQQDLVDGSIEYDYASIARQHHCKGNYFVAKENQTMLWLMTDLDPPRTYDK